MSSVHSPTKSKCLCNTISDNGSNPGGQEEPSLEHSAALSRHRTNTEHNIRATLLTGYTIYGDAILASAGSDWRSEGHLVCDNVDLGQYYRYALLSV